jgi:hypothetical protein
VCIRCVKHAESVSPAAFVFRQDLIDHGVCDGSFARRDPTSRLPTIGGMDPIQGLCAGAAQGELDNLSIKSPGDMNLQYSSLLGRIHAIPDVFGCPVITVSILNLAYAEKIQATTELPG